MATFLNTIKHKLTVDTHLNLTKPQMKKIYLRNVNETDEKESILFIQALEDPVLGPTLASFLCQVTSQEEEKAIPNVDVWDMKASSYKRGIGEVVAESEKLLVTAEKLEGETVRYHIRVYQK